MTETLAPITVVATGKVTPGKLDELIAVATELVAHTQDTEDGAMSYRWFLSEDKTEVTVIETYENSAAVMFHGSNYVPFIERLAPLRSTTSITLYGDLSPELRAVVDKAGYQVNASMSGFIR